MQLDVKCLNLRRFKGVMGVKRWKITSDLKLRLFIVRRFSRPYSHYTVYNILYIVRASSENSRKFIS